MKHVFNGVVKLQNISAGKSERHGPVLDTGAATYPLRMVGDNPFEAKAFDPFINKKVRISGEMDKTCLLVAGPADITVQP